MHINIVVCVGGGGVVPGKAEEDLFAILMTYSKAWSCFSSHLFLLLLILREEGEKYWDGRHRKGPWNSVWACDCLSYFLKRLEKSRLPHLTSVFGFPR